MSRYPVRGWRLALSAAVLLLASCTNPGQAGPVLPDATPHEDAPPSSGIVPVAQAGPGVLDSFFGQVLAMRAGDGKQIRIIQLGDSHTAADFFTGQLRDTLQAHLGYAGIGTRAAGLPYAGIRKKDMTLTQAGRWQYHNSLTDHGFTDYGLSGFTAVSRSAGARLSLTATDPRGFDQGFVDFVHQPGGGGIDILLDDKPVTSADVSGPAGTLGRVTFTAPSGGAHSLTLVARNPGIEILAWNTQRNDAGVVLDSFGVVGATAGVIDNWNPNLVRQELAAMGPALIILAYGTNEGARTNFDAATYQQQYGEILAKLRRWTPGSSLLVIGPTDGAKQIGGALQRLPAVDTVRQIQAIEAARHHAAFWNSADPELRSGGIAAWAAMNPPLARPDHIHFTPPGYTILANEFYYWLSYWFQAYARVHRAGETAL